MVSLHGVFGVHGQAGNGLQKDGFKTYPVDALPPRLVARLNLNKHMVIEDDHATGDRRAERKMTAEELSRRCLSWFPIRYGPRDNFDGYPFCWLRSACVAVTVFHRLAHVYRAVGAWDPIKDYLLV